MARKSKDASPRAADEAKDVQDELVASGEGSEDDALLAEGEPVGPWSDDEDEETVAFDAALEDDEEIDEPSDDESDGDSDGAPAAYQAAATEVDPERKRR